MPVRATSTCSTLPARPRPIGFVFHSVEDGAWVADIPDLQYCSALGSTPEQAVAEVEKARDLWLEVARETGKPVPEPRYRPTTNQVR